jgi:hypothetical protein
MSESLCGAWKLVHWKRISENGGTNYPLGADATGSLIYTEGGQMAVTMAAAGRPPLDTTDPLGGGAEDRAAAYSGYLTYFGTYSVADGQVTHRIEASLYPNWSGAEQTRPYTHDGASLVLRTPPTTLPDGSVVVNEMSWTRIT